METKRNRGFTLVEILIVVVILGILAAIVIPQFSQASSDANLSSLKSNLQTIRSQIELFKIQHLDVPPAVATFEAQMTTFSDPSGATSATRDAAHQLGPYLQKIPDNPFDADGVNADAVAGAVGDGWTYTRAGDATIGYSCSFVANDGGTTNGEVHADL